jgi:hypothetical protein
MTRSSPIAPETALARTTAVLAGAVEEVGAAEAADGHGGGEAGVDERPGGGVHAVPVHHEQRQPVVGGALGQRHRQDDRADQDELGVLPEPGPRPAGAGFPGCAGAGARGDGADGVQEHRGRDQGDRGQMPVHRQAGGGGRDACAGAHDRAQAEAAVQDGHGRLPGDALDVGGVDVDRDLAPAHARAEREQARHDQGSRRQQAAGADDGQAGDDQRGADAHDGLGPEARDEPPRAQDPDHGAERQAEQDQAHLGGGRLQAVTQVRGAGHPRRHRDSGEEEEQEQRLPAPSRGEVHAAP